MSRKQLEELAPLRHRRSFFGFDTGGTIPGWTTGETWNGFAVPCFTARQLPAAMALLRDGDLYVKKHGDDVLVMFHGDPESVGIVWCFKGYTWNEYPRRRMRP